MKIDLKDFISKSIHSIKRSFLRTIRGGRLIRHSRLRKFKNKYRSVSIFAQLVAIWYLTMFAAIHFTGDTGAAFNDVETIAETISAAEDYCKDAKEGSEFWRQRCKDNAGIGNGPEPVDEDTGEGTDPDNPGHNKDGCDDHTSAPCSDNSRITDLQKNISSDSIQLTWNNPQDQKFSSVTIYRNEELVAENIKDGEFEDKGLTPSTTYLYKLIMIDKQGKTIHEEVIEIITTESEKETQTPEESSSKEEAKPSEEKELSKEEDEAKPTEGEESPEKEDKQPPAEVTTLKSERNGNNITLTWVNPSDEDFTHISIYIEESANPIKSKVADSKIDLQQNPNEKVTYRLTTVDASGNESAGTLITVEEKQ
jgi:PKD repeat protein